MGWHILNRVKIGVLKNWLGHRDDVVKVRTVPVKLVWTVSLYKLKTIKRACK